MFWRQMCSPRKNWGMGWNGKVVSMLFNTYSCTFINCKKSIILTYPTLELHKIDKRFSCAPLGKNASLWLEISWSSKVIWNSLLYLSKEIHYSTLPLGWQMILDKSKRFNSSQLIKILDPILTSYRLRLEHYNWKHAPSSTKIAKKS